jgi:hypothetical protein
MNSSRLQISLRLKSVKRRQRLLVIWWGRYIKLRKREYQRKRIATEMVTTEVTYQDGLCVIFHPCPDYCILHTQ